MNVVYTLETSDGFSGQTRGVFVQNHNRLSETITYVLTNDAGDLYLVKIRVSGPVDDPQFEATTRCVIGG